MRFPQLAALFLLSALAVFAFSDHRLLLAAPAGAQGASGCRAEMVRVQAFCIDRWEVAAVDNESGRPLSPFYAPEPRALKSTFLAWQVERALALNEAGRRMPLPKVPPWQRSGSFSPRAVALPGVLPQGYLSYYTAKKACENAGKRLCTEREWITACQGQRQSRHPYGDSFERDKCNVYRWIHPAKVLHGDASVGHRDPRLHLLLENGKTPLLALTGDHPQCASVWGNDRIFDMVGNLDEWVEDERGLFLGGFYARSTTKGCEARVGNHARAYYDYSLGTRCCSAAGQALPGAPSTR